MLVGKQLKIKRIELDVKAKTIAQDLNVSGTYISLMENGKENIPIKMYRKWIEVLEIHSLINIK